jgi:hypothetical protein
MSPAAYVYLDYGQFGGDDQYEYFGNLAPVHRIYEYDPTGDIRDQYKQYIIGVQGNLWTEYVWAQDDLEWKLWPRAAAVAEIAWTNVAEKDWGRFIDGFAQIEADRLNQLQIHAAGIASGLPATWEPGEIPTRWVTMQWPVTGAVHQSGSYQIAFVYTGGDDALRINNVKLYIAGFLAGTDNHEGVAGAYPIANIYTVPESVIGGTVEAWITANVSCTGRGDSQGSVFVYIE